MEIDNLKIKAIELQMQSHDDLVSAVKLHFAFSTGAAVLLVNAAAQPSALSVGFQFACLSALTLAALCFAASAVRAMRATIRFSIIKSSIARSLGAADETVGKIGDQWLSGSQGKIDDLKKELATMQKVFGLGMVGVIFFVFFRLLAAGTVWLNAPHPSIPLK